MTARPVSAPLGIRFTLSRSVKSCSRITNPRHGEDLKERLIDRDAARSATPQLATTQEHSVAEVDHLVVVDLEIDCLDPRLPDGEERFAAAVHADKLRRKGSKSLRFAASAAWRTKRDVMARRSRERGGSHDQKEAKLRRSVGNRTKIRSSRVRRLEFETLTGVRTPRTPFEFSSDIAYSCRPAASRASPRPAST